MDYHNVSFLFHLSVLSPKPLPIPNEPWEGVSMDFMTQPLKWNGMDAILIVINQVFKLTKMVPTKMVTITFNLLKLFFNMWVKHHGMLQFIVSEKDAKFMMGFWKHYSKGGDEIAFWYNIPPTNC